MNIQTAIDDCLANPTKLRLENEKLRHQLSSMRRSEERHHNILVSLQKKIDAGKEAVATLDSEREMNRLLTDSLEKATKALLEIVLDPENATEIALAAVEEISLDIRVIF